MIPRVDVSGAAPHDIGAAGRRAVFRALLHTYRITLVCRRCRRLLDRADAALDRGDRAQAARRVDRAHAILNEVQL